MRIPVLGAVVLVTACVLFAPQPAQAWHKEGHMAVALIAYRQLAPDEQKKVDTILKKHPHFDVFLSADAPADADPSEWVAMRAAIWPDWIKQPTSITNRATRSEITRSFSHGDWHYTNKPIEYLVDASDGDKMKIQANIDNPKKKRGEIMNKLPDLIAGVKGEGNVDLVKLVWASATVDPTINADEAKAVAVCWILHLVGDIHQPLHAAALFSKDSLDGDAGGNAFIVRWVNHSTNLHSIWDGEFGWDDLKTPLNSYYAVIDTLARDLLSRVKPTDAEKAEMRFEKWRDESWELAKSKAYFVNGKLLPGVFVAFGEHKPRAADLEKLPDGYATMVTKVVEQRVTLSGYRMGTLLKDLVAP